MTDSKQEKKDNSTNEKRRKVLKTASLAGGVVAAGSQWHKPILNAVLLPAHAQTSVASPTPPPATSPTTLSGGSSFTGPIINVDRDSNVENIASRLMNSLVPQAHAAVGDTPGAIWSGLVNDVDDYQHCVSLTLPEGEATPNSVDISLEGPTIYYDYDSASSTGGTYYYYNSVNLSGTSTATPLTENAGSFEFSTIINGIEVCGSIDSTLTAASGALLISPGFDFGNASNDMFGDLPNSLAFSSSGYGAYWSISEGGSCSAGAGLSNTQLTPEV